MIEGLTVRPEAELSFTHQMPTSDFSAPVLNYSDCRLVAQLVRAPP
jgi:hypothetical protein